VVSPALLITASRVVVAHTFVPCKALRESTLTLVGMPMPEATIALSSRPRNGEGPQAYYPAEPRTDVDASRMSVRFDGLSARQPWIRPQLVHEVF
jgi:hypothetical protein